MADTTTLVDGLHFGEGPRWHDGRLWFSDFYAHRVRSVGVDGDVRDELEVPGQPSGLGWLPDGRLLVVSMTDRRVLRREADGSLVEHADLSGIATFHCNDMLVDPAGRAYVGNFGFDLHTFIRAHGEAAIFVHPDAHGAVVALVRPDGTVEAATEELRFPNGTVLADGGRTLVVAETLGLRLTAFDVDADGRLSNRRTWADLSDHLVAPDGICIDAEGAIWCANAVATQAVRVAEGGEVLARVETERHCYAVALGGSDGRSLFCCTAETSDAIDAAARRTGAIETVAVDVAAA